MNINFYVKLVTKLGLVNSIKWFLAAKLNKNTALKIYKGQPVVNIRSGTSDVALFIHIFVNEEYFLPEKIDEIYDLGANVGYSIIYFSHHYPNAKIIAYEPDEKNFKQLEMNVAHLNNIVLHNKGVWWRNANLVVIDDTVDSWGLQFTETETDGGVKAEGIEQILCQGGTTRHTRMIKMDIEGAEKMIFDKVPDFCKNIDWLQVEIHDCWNEFFSCMSESEVADTIMSGENIVLNFTVKT